MIQLPHDEIRKLSNNFPPLRYAKSRHAIDNIQKMASFYEAKSVEREGKISTIFKHYGITLMYVCSIIKMHRQLTEELARLAGEAKRDVEDTDSR